MVKTPLLIVLILGCLFVAIQPTQAVWHTLLQETFAGNPLNWPWGNWEILPNLPPQGTGPPFTWGTQNFVSKPRLPNIYSLWCVGQPNSMNPIYNVYPPNTEAWVKWGPIDLSEAVAAKASFYYYGQTELVVDYMRWGAFPNNAWSMYEADRFSGGPTGNWMNGYVYFDSVGPGGMYNLLGGETVYLLFQFYSDPYGTAYMGAFIDEVIIAWDDGEYDLIALNAFIADLDSTSLITAVMGDSIRFGLYWMAEGPDSTRLFDIQCWLDGELYYSERRNAVITNGYSQTYNTYSAPWLVSPGEHTFHWYLDTANEVREVSETNNDDSLTFEGNTPPWISITHPTWGDTATIGFTIQWEDEDPDNNAYIALYWDDDSTGYDGTCIAMAIPEDDPSDSFLWLVGTLPDGEYWVYASIADPYTTFWDYSDGPLTIDRSPPPNVPPQITITHPQRGDTAYYEFTITWTDEDPDDDAVISLFWDNNESGQDGESIIAGISENDPADSYLWDMSEIDLDSVWVYASIFDGDTTVYNYSDGPLMVLNTIPNIMIVHPANGDTARDEFMIVWEDFDPDDAALIALYWDENGEDFDGTLIPGAENLEENSLVDSFLWDITGITQDFVWVYASISDADTTIWNYSSGPLVIDHSPSFVWERSGSEPPAVFSVESIYPNPFNNSAQIRFGLPSPEQVQIRIFDSLGRLCEIPLNGRLSPGYHEVTWMPDDLPSGVYLVEVVSQSIRHRAKVVYLK